MASTVLSGAAFGASLLLAGFHQPVAIISQLRLENSHMVQVFITATATSAQVLPLLFSCFRHRSSRNFRTDKENSAVYPVLQRLDLVPRLQPRSSSPLLGLLSTYDGNILGGALLGAGMALASACPGTLLVQVAVGIRAAAFTLAGSVLGGVIWSGVLRGAIKTQAEQRELKSNSSTLEETIGISRDAMVVLFVAMCAGVVGSAATYTDRVSWAVFPGVVGGLFIGGAQLFSLVARKTMMGISGSYEEIGNYVAWAIRGQPASSRPTAYKNILFGAGVTLGAWMLKVTTPQFVPDPVGDVSGGLAFLGGVLMTIGSRMAGGCTSGHGISGLSLMSTSSAMTIAGTFAGGILAARLI